MPLTERDVARQLRALRWYAVISSTFIAAIGLSAFVSAPGSARFRELTVERLNVVEANGRPRLTISNAALAPPWIMNGHVIPGRPQSAGMIFYNDEGVEDGGLIFGGRHNPDGTYTAGGSLTFDQFNQDQVVALQYYDENGVRRQGLSIIDRATRPTVAEYVLRSDSISRMPDGAAKELARARLDSMAGPDYAVGRAFFGKLGNGDAVVRLSDRHGHPRARLVVDSTGDARLEFLDQTGRVTARFPQG